MKRFLYYFIWTIGIGFVLFYGMLLQEQFAAISQRTFDVFPLQAYIALFPVLMGVLIRTPQWILQKRKSESWFFDWQMFLAVGFPSLFLVLMAFLPYSPFGEGWLAIPEILLFGDTTVPTIAGIVFGYVLLNSFTSGKSQKPFRKSIENK